MVLARAQAELGATAANEASAPARAVERELAAVEDALDGLLEILRTSSPRQERKRTRAAALEIAQARLDAVAACLRVELDASALERLEVRAPRFEVVEGLDSGQVVVELRER